MSVGSLLIQQLKDKIKELETKVLFLERNRNIVLLPIQTAQGTILIPSQNTNQPATAQQTASTRNSIQASTQTTHLSNFYQRSKMNYFLASLTTQ